MPVRNVNINSNSPIVAIFDPFQTAVRITFVRITSFRDRFSFFFNKRDLRSGITEITLGCLYFTTIQLTLFFKNLQIPYFIFH